ncbi:MAG: NADH-quinone oxidoreductase subunit J [Acidimicrobiia bacterium]|jgi:NADH-quinone oxidoreductase subunit J|nr:NADH-quinone oxidoreductase subunit J [Acidimicrobiia bacterium]
MELAVFIAGALVCVAGALGVITSDNPVHSALSLVGTLFGIAVLFIAQDAEFLAAVQIIVYAGAIVVLFLFVIMLLGVDSTDDITVEPLSGQRPLAAVAGVALAVGLAAVVVLGTVSGERSTKAGFDEGVPNVTQIARLLFTDYLWAFEITSVLLVIAVVGAVVLARHRRDDMVDADVVDTDLIDDKTTGEQAVS